jgi:8-hydroxy-5-deazaflavin:NADPH oxidoreductase
VFLALPWRAALPFVEAVRAHLDGRVVVDLTNPLRPALDGLEVADGTSASEEIARAAGPRTRVVAALKNTFAVTFAEPTIAGGPAPDVLIAGDDEAAREQVAGLVRAMGFAPLDAGPLVAARIIERMTLLLLQLNGRHHWNGQAGFKLVHG